MSTSTEHAEPVTGRPPAGPWPALLRQAALVVLLCAVVGAVAGYVWFRVWDPQVGVVYDGVWYLDEQGLRDEFPATGWFVVVGAVTGLLLGVASAFLARRSELVTLAALVVGSALATYLMWRVGLALGPPDPDVLARAADDADRLPGQIEVSGRSPFLALPGVALAALTVVYATVPARVRHRA